MDSVVDSVVDAVVDVVVGVVRVVVVIDVVVTVVVVVVLVEAVMKIKYMLLWWFKGPLKAHDYLSTCWAQMHLITCGRYCSCCRCRSCRRQSCGCFALD